MIDATTKPIKDPDTAPTMIFTGIYHLQICKELTNMRAGKVTAAAFV
jgi:hypothetical protein